MKRSFIVLLSMLFVLGSFAAVSADDGGMDSVRSATAGSKVTIGGDAYVEGYWLSNHDMDSDVDEDNRFWNQRVRLKVHAAIGGVEVRTRLTTGDQEWDDANNTGSGVAVDYAYLHVPVAEPVTLDFGRQKADWGNKLLEWNVNKDRAKVTVTAVPDVTLGVYADKIVETYDFPGDDNLADRDDYGVFGKGNFGPVEAGVLAIMHADSRTNADTGQSVSLYGNAEIAGVGISAELAARTGDIFAYTDIATGEEVDDMQLGFFASGAYSFGPVDVEGLVGMTMGGYIADSHFNPTLMTGTDQTTAIMEFGGFVDPASGAEVSMDTMLVAATGSFQAVPDRLGVYARVAVAMAEEMAAKFGGIGTVDTTYEHMAIETDLGLEYQIADNTTFNFDFGYLMVDAESGGVDQDLDDAFSVGQSINISF